MSNSVPLTAAGADDGFARLVAEIRACALCRPHLPLGPRPVLRGRPSARLLLISQAPGTRAHETGLSFDDRSGEMLRRWLALGRERFYDENLVAIMPMGFCYPGRAPRGGDLPPRRECAPRWHRPLRAFFSEVALTLLIGGHAIRHYLPDTAMAPTMTEAIRRWRDFLPDFVPLPHPSWRSIRWQRDHPWFERELLPELQMLVAAALSPTARCVPCRRR